MYDFGLPFKIIFKIRYRILLTHFDPVYHTCHLVYRVSLALVDTRSDALLNVIPCTCLFVNINVNVYSARHVPSIIRPQPEKET